jgi:hypothetical protein
MKCRIALGLTCGLYAQFAHAEMQKLAEVTWWAAYGGVADNGVFTCAMLTSTPDGRGGQFIIEHRAGGDALLLRFLKPTWAIEPGSKKQFNLRFGYYGPLWEVSAIGEGAEVRGGIPVGDAEKFLSGFQGAGRIDVEFIGGTETPWELTTSGGGFVLPDFLKCIRMQVPVEASPPTQP